MKTRFLWILAAGAAVLAGCTSDLFSPGRQGAAVAFGAATTYRNSIPDTKTAYSGTVYSDGYRKVERIDWVTGDRLTVECPQSPEGQANYVVLSEEESLSSSYAKVTAEDGNGLTWGTGTHLFRAMYPATEQMFRGTIPAVQAVLRDDGTPFTDMQNAYMWAAAQADAESSGAVTLGFRPMMTAFQFTIRADDGETLVLKAFSLSSARTALAGTFTATLREDLSDVDYTFSDTSMVVSANLEGITLTDSAPLQITLFCLPQDLTEMTVAVETSAGTKKMDLKKDGEWLTFAGGLKLRIDNMPVQTRDLLFEGTARGKFCVQTVNKTSPNPTQTTWVTPRADSTFSLRLPKLPTATHYSFIGADSLLTVTKLPAEVSTDKTAYHMFYSCKTLTEVDVPVNTEGLTDFTGMFYGCTSLRAAPEMDLSSGTTFLSLFEGCRALTDVPAYDFSNGTNLKSAFASCSSLTAVPCFGLNGASKTLAGCFRGCSRLQSVPVLETSSVVNCQQLFQNCTSLKEAPDWDLSAVKTCESMFQGCTALTSVPAYNTTVCTTFKNIFKGCTKLREIPLIETGNATSFYGFFASCSALQTIPVLDTSKGKDFGYFVYYCSSLKAFPAIDVSKGTNFKCMFQGTYTAPFVNSVPHLDMSSGTNFDSFTSSCRMTSCEGFGAIKVSFTIAHTLLDRDSIVKIFNQLATVTSGTITLKTDTVNYHLAEKLSDEDKAIATEKGWTLQY